MNSGAIKTDSARREKFTIPCTAKTWPWAVDDNCARRATSFGSESSVKVGLPFTLGSIGLKEYNKRTISNRRRHSLFLIFRLFVCKIVEFNVAARLTTVGTDSKRAIRPEYLCGRIWHAHHPHKHGAVCRTVSTNSHVPKGHVGAALWAEHSSGNHLLTFN